MKTIYHSLLEYSNQNICPMHMPGHKRNSKGMGINLPFDLDITEINGFDNLHDPEGMILKSQELAASLYKSNHTFYLVNGSTCGILAAIRAVVNPGDKIIMTRNCHRSVYHAVEMNELYPIYLIPKRDKEFGVYGSVHLEDAKEAIEANLDTKLIVLTSPTYEGVISDIKGIAEIAHKYNIPLLVDEAHGAHLGFSDFFPGSSVAAGADIVINSLHKTLPALTQTALCHINGELVSSEEVKRQLSIFETSSPSYVLLSSIDACIHMLANKKEVLFVEYEGNLRYFSNSVKGLQTLKVLAHGDDRLDYHPDIYMFDKGKIIISTRYSNITGNELSTLLRENYRIELEMAYSDYVIAMTSIFDSRDNLIRLAKALLEIDLNLIKASCEIKGNSNEYLEFHFPLPRYSMSIQDALRREKLLLPLEEAIGKISREYVYFYPPGIPILVPGEEIDVNLVEFLKEMMDKNMMPKSTSGKIEKYIEVIKF